MYVCIANDRSCASKKKGAFALRNSMCKDNSSNCYPDRRRFHINLLMHMNTGKGKSTIHFLKV